MRTPKLGLLLAAVIAERLTLILRYWSPVELVSKQPLALIDPLQKEVFPEVIAKLVHVEPLVVYCNLKVLGAVFDQRWSQVTVIFWYMAVLTLYCAPLASLAEPGSKGSNAQALAPFWFPQPVPAIPVRTIGVMVPPPPLMMAEVPAPVLAVGVASTPCCGSYVQVAICALTVPLMIKNPNRHKDLRKKDKGNFMA